MKGFRDQGIDVLTGQQVRFVEKDGARFRVRAGKDGDHSFAADMVVHGAGRVPNLAGLDLAAGGVALDARGNIAVNEFLQSVTNPSVYVAGDAKGKPLQLSPVATLEGLAAVRNMLHGNHVAPDYTAVASVVFTNPPLASVGLREDQAVARGISAVVSRQETPEWYSNRRVGIAHAGYAILTDRESGKILGAHFLGYNADELINIFALAIHTGTTLAELRDIPWAYPTAGYDIIRIR
jgi:glutathione reductase (NADPH)